MLNIRSIFIIILCLNVIAGCTSKPREVSASIPLVTMSQEKPNKKEIPSKYWAVLSDAKKSSFEHDNYQVKLAALYTSALGMLCRQLTLIDKKNKEERLVACEATYLTPEKQQKKAWFLEKKIIESSIYVEL